MPATVAPPGRDAVAVPAVLPTAPKPWRWSADEVIRLAERRAFAGRNVQLVRGELLDMGVQGWGHARATTAVVLLLRAVFAGVAFVLEEKPLRAADDSLPVPDAAVHPGRLADLTDHPRGALLVVEVADSSLFFDLTTKAEVYAAAGVRDYWVLDLDGRVLHVLRDPGAVTAGGSAYRSVTVFTAADAVIPLAAAASPVAVADLLP